MDKRNNKKTQENTQNGTKSPLIRKQFNGYQCLPDSIQDPISQTVPDMSLTIPELVKNHTRGLSTDIHQPEEQYFDTEIPVFTDLTDRQLYLDQLNIQKQQLEEQIIQDKADSAHRKEMAEIAKLKKETEDYEKLKAKHEPEPILPSI